MFPIVREYEKAIKLVLRPSVKQLRYVLVRSGRVDIGFDLESLSVLFTIGES
jgi:hypothetical protein